MPRTNIERSIHVRKHDKLTANWTDERDGKQKVEELKKEILTRGAWTTIMYLIRELDSKTGQFGTEDPHPEISEKGDSYMPRSKFTITNAKQAYQIMEIMKKWYPENPGAIEAAGESDSGSDSE